MEYIKTYGSDTYDVHIFITDEDDFIYLLNSLREEQIKFPLNFGYADKNDILEDIKGFKIEDVEFKKFKFFNIVTVITYG